MQTDTPQKPKRFRSCFISDVQFTCSEARLQDTSGQFWMVDLKDKKLASQFTDWFKTRFLKRTAQELTVFQYETVEVSECELETRIVNFVSCANEQLLAD